MHATLATPVSGRCAQAPAPEQESTVHGSPSSQGGPPAPQAAAGIVVVVEGGVVLVVDVVPFLGRVDEVDVVVVVVEDDDVDVVVAAGQSGIGSWTHALSTQASVVHGSRSLQILGAPGLHRRNPSSPTQRSAPLHRSPSSQSSSDTHPSGGGGGAASSRGAYPTTRSASSAPASVWERFMRSSSTPLTATSRVAARYPIASLPIATTVRLH